MKKVIVLAVTLVMLSLLTYFTLETFISPPPLYAACGATCCVVDGKAQAGCTSDVPNCTCSCSCEICKCWKVAV